VTHELAHIILEHTPTFNFFNPQKQLFIRSYDRAQEDEANWLAATILLPRQALLYVRRQRLGKEEICRRYGVSERLLAFRVNTTGVERQLSASRKHKR
jgi:Zn-dependent peptidase ImmA (M78 family)